MPAAQMAFDTSSSIVGKAALCARLQWARTTLDRRLKSDPMFPIRKRGSLTGGWEFDVDVVREYLETSALRLEEASDATAPEPAAPQRLEHVGEATARQRRDNAQAQMIEDKLRRARGELVEADQMRAAISQAFGHLGVKLNGLPDKIVRELNLPELAAVRIRGMIDAERRAIVAEIRDLLDE